MKTIFIFLALSLFSCGIPKDPGNTLNEIRNGTLRAGLAENPPWTVWKDGNPSGVEADIIKGIAQELNARIKWKHASAEELFPALEKGELDIVAAGLTKSSPWTSKFGASNPYLKTHLIIGIPPGIDSSEANLRKMKIGVPFGSEEKSVLQNDGYEIKEVYDLQNYGGPVAAYDYQISGLNKIPARKKFKVQAHILPVEKGENAWLVYIENYVRENKNQINKSLKNYGNAE